MATIILKDGGTGQELMARSSHPPSKLWSAEVMEREPDLVEAVHRDFIAAGSSLITLNSYTATPERLGREMSPAAAMTRFEALQHQAIAIAQAACQDAPHPVSIAGCLPPLVASFHAEVSPDFDTSLASYRRIVPMQKPACAVMLIETMSSLQEAQAAARACAENDCRAWVSFSVKDDDGTRLRSGTPLTEAVDAVLAEGAEAVLLNCSRPEAITNGLKLLAGRDVAFGAYANGFIDASELKVGTTVEGMGVRTDLGPDAYADYAAQWIADGATIIGGCCEVGPKHIARLHEQITQAGHDVVAPA